MAELRLVVHKPATAIFNLIDRYAADKGLRGPIPRPFGDIAFWLTGRESGGRMTAFSTPRRLRVLRNPSGYFLFFDNIEIGAKNYRDQLPEGRYRIRIESLFYQDFTGEFSLPAPDTAFDIDLQPGYRYPFIDGGAVRRGGDTLLRGTLHQTDGAGMAAVEIAVAGRSNLYRTNESGQWVLLFADSGAGGVVDVTFTFPDGRTEVVGPIEISAGNSTSLYQAGLRGSVTRANGIPVEGARITVSGHSGRSLSRGDGNWFFYFDLDQGEDFVDVTATLPGGASLTRSGILVQPRALVVVPGFQFTRTPY